VDQKTDGRLQIEIFYGRALGYEGPEILTVLKEGLVDVADFSGGVNAAEIGQEWWSWQDLTYPLIQNWYQELYILDNLGPQYRQDMADFGVVFAGWTPGMPNGDMQGIFTNWKLEKSLKELEGMQLRVYQVKMREIFDHLGFSSMFVPGSEVYGALKTGLVDGARHSLTSAVSNHYYEVVDNFYVCEPYADGIRGVCISQKSFDALPEDIQTAVWEAGLEYQTFVNWEVYRNTNFYTQDGCPDQYPNFKGLSGATSAAPAYEFLLTTGLNMVTVPELQNVLAEVAMEELKTFAEAAGPKAMTAYQIMLEARELFDFQGNPFYNAMPQLDVSR
jgi:TRAP-type C4-dicarboxylate transport system substrate-binding protein